MHGRMAFIGDGEIVETDRSTHANATAQPIVAQRTAMPAATKTRRVKAERPIRDEAKGSLLKGIRRLS
jgi:hypothetical protein